MEVTQKNYQVSLSEDKSTCSYCSCAVIFRTSADLAGMLSGCCAVGWLWTEKDPWGRGEVVPHSDLYVQGCGWETISFSQLDEYGKLEHENPNLWIYTFPHKGPWKVFISWIEGLQHNLFCFLFFSVSLVFVLLHSFWVAGWKVIPGDKVNLISGTVPAKQGDDCWVLGNIKRKTKHNAALKSVWRQSLQAAPCRRLQRIKALIYLGNTQAKCYAILLVHLDVRTVSLSSNHYGTGASLISFIHLIRPGRMLCWSGQAALGPRWVSLQGRALSGMGLGCEIPPVLCGTWWVCSWCLVSVLPLLNPLSCSVTEALVCFGHAGVLSWENEGSCSNWWAPLCGKHVSGLCLINLQITDSLVTVSLSWVDSTEERVHASLLL